MGCCVYKIEVGQLQTNCYILAPAKSKECAIIDPGADYKAIKALIDAKKLNPLFIINTHGHADHIMANANFHLPVYIHEQDALCLSDPARNLSYAFTAPVRQHISPQLLYDGDSIKLATLSIKVIYTPGHTLGSICLLCEDVLFSGDTLFALSIGRTDIPFSDETKIISSIKSRLLVLPDDTKVYPGHGPQTTIGKEKKSNPWLY